MIDETYFLYNNLKKEYLNNIILWFFPELLEIEEFVKDKILNCIIFDLNQKVYDIVNLSTENNIENFKKMRDSGVPDDKIAQAIIEDDVNALQTFISQNNINVISSYICFYLYDFDDDITLINYAAKNGSIKCFKYLLLNHSPVDISTFKYSIIGRNVEIIRIVDNYLNEHDVDITENISNVITQSIITHNYDIFDWLLENKLNLSKNKDLFYYAKIAADNGNLYSLTKLFENGLVLNDDSDEKNDDVKDIIIKASKRGFYQLTQILLSIVDISSYGNFYSSVSFGNLSLFKLFCSKQNKLLFRNNRYLYSAIKKGHINIVKYIIEEFNEPDQKEPIQNFFKYSMTSKNIDIFNYLEQRFDFQYLIDYFKFTSDDFISVLLYSCIPKNIEPIKKFIDFIVINFPECDLTNLLIHFAKCLNEESCLYLINQNVQLNQKTILENYQIFGFGDGSIALKLIEISDYSFKKTLSCLFMDESIKTKNYQISIKLIDQNLIYKNCLFDIVESHNVELVDKILQINSKPYFINQFSDSGTVLNIAVKNNDMQIIQRLLSIPGININSYEPKNGDTPLISAIKNKNNELAILLINNPQTNINWRNMKQHTALTLAIYNQMEDVVLNIINHESFDPEESNLDYAFYISSNHFAEQLSLIEGLDVNYCHEEQSKETKKTLFKTTLMHAIKNEQFDKIDIIINHKSFDQEKSLIINAILLSMEMNQKAIYQKLLNIVDINVAKKFYKYHSHALNHEKKECLQNAFETREKTIDKNIFYQIFFLSPLEIKRKLIEYDLKNNHLIDFEQLLPNGKSFYTQINKETNDISSTVQLFLENNVDPNCPDKFGVYPLEHAIKMGSLSFVQTLIKSEKIDFSIKLKNTQETFLHLAARYNSQNILSEIYQFTENDINSLDIYGETPIIKAIYANNEKNIMLLNRINENDTSALFVITNGDENIYLNGKEASIYYKLQADNGSSKGMNHYGRILNNGWGIPIDREMACLYYKLAAENNNDVGLNNYGYMLTHGIGTKIDYKKAIKCLKKAIIHGNITAMVNYGYMLDNGLGVQVDHDEASRYYDLVAEKGKVALISKFASFFENGLKIPVNEREACRYYKIAADKGDMNAVFHYGRMLETGFGIEKNTEMAIKYYSMAAKKGHKEAEMALEKLKT